MIRGKKTFLWLGTHFVGCSPVGLYATKTWKKGELWCLSTHSDRANVIKQFHYTELLIVIQQHKHDSRKFYGSLLPILVFKTIIFTNSASVWRCLEVLDLAHFAVGLILHVQCFSRSRNSNIAGWSIQGLPIPTYFTQKLLGPGMLPKTSKTSSNYPFLDTRKGHIHIYAYIFELLPWIHLTDGATSSLTLNWYLISITCKTLTRVQMFIINTPSILSIHGTCECPLFLQKRPFPIENKYHLSSRYYIMIKYMYINKYTNIISVCLLISSIWHVFKCYPSESPVFIPWFRPIFQKNIPGSHWS